MGNGRSRRVYVVLRSSVRAMDKLQIPRIREFTNTHFCLCEDQNIRILSFDISTEALKPETPLISTVLPSVKPRGKTRVVTSRAYLLHSSSKPGHVPGRDPQRSRMPLRELDTLRYRFIIRLSIRRESLSRFGHFAILRSSLKFAFRRCFAFSASLSSLDRKSTRLNSSHSGESRMPSSA